jgi:hypothetical protein
LGSLKAVLPFSGCFLCVFCAVFLPCGGAKRGGLSFEFRIFGYKLPLFGAA